MIPKDAMWPAVIGGVDQRQEPPASLWGKARLVAQSPPYYAKAKYSDAGDEWGAGTVGEYVADCVSAACWVEEILSPGGWWALNIGDTRSNTGGAGGDVAKAGQRIYRPQPEPGIKGQQWLGIPWRVADEIRRRTSLQLAGHVIWDKGVPVRSDNSEYHLYRNRRPGLQHEDIFLFWLPGAEQTWNASVLTEAGEIGSVWRIPKTTTRPPRALRSDDIKPWPDALAERLVLLLSNPGDLVVDPTAGYGTTGRVALHHDRRAICFDLYHPWIPGEEEAAA